MIWFLPTSIVRYVCIVQNLAFPSAHQGHTITTASAVSVAHRWKTQPVSSAHNRGGRACAAATSKPHQCEWRTLEYKGSSTTSLTKLYSWSIVLEDWVGWGSVVHFSSYSYSYKQGWTIRTFFFSISCNWALFWVHYSRKDRTVCLCGVTLYSHSSLLWSQYFHSCCLCTLFLETGDSLYSNLTWTWTMQTNP